MSCPGYYLTCVRNPQRTLKSKRTRKRPGELSSVVRGTPGSASQRSQRNQRQERCRWPQPGGERENRTPGTSTRGLEPDCLGRRREWFQTTFLLHVNDFPNNRASVFSQRDVKISIPLLTRLNHREGRGVLTAIWAVFSWMLENRTQTQFAFPLLFLYLHFSCCANRPPRHGTQYPGGKPWSLTPSLWTMNAFRVPLLCT